MWSAVIPFLAEYGLPALSGLTAAGQTLSQTGDPLKALAAGGVSAAGTFGLGKVGGQLGGKLATRMAGQMGTTPGLVTQGAGQMMQATDALRQALPALGTGAALTLGAPVVGAASNLASGLVPSVGGIANAALGGGGLLSNAMQPRPTGNMSAYQPPDISQYGPNGIYGAFAMENPLGAGQEALRYSIEQARAQDEINKITTPYAREQARQAYGEELQRQAASYQQKSGLDTAAAMLKQAQYGGQQAGINAQQAINNAISGPQRSYF